MHWGCLGSGGESRDMHAGPPPDRRGEGVDAPDPQQAFVLAIRNHAERRLLQNVCAPPCMTRRLTLWDPACNCSVCAAVHVPLCLTDGCLH